MTSSDTPFPRTLAALERLTPRQLRFCMRVQTGAARAEVYAEVYGAGKSRHPARAASKIMNAPAARAYFRALGEETHIRGRIDHEADLREIELRRSGGFNRREWTRARLEEARRGQMEEMAAERLDAAIRPKREPVSI